MYSGTNQDPGHEEETFHPKINQRSKEMGRGRYLKGTKSVHNRLYSEAVDTTERQQQVRRRGRRERRERRGRRGRRGFPHPLPLVLSLVVRRSRVLQRVARVLYGDARCCSGGTQPLP